MTSSADLLALQEIDLRRDSRRALIADVDARLGETEELIAAREGIEDAEAAVQRLRRRQKEVDDLAEDLDAKARPLEKKLYDGSVRNPKDLGGMQHELDSFKKQRGKLDDEGLSLMEAMEAANAALAGAKSEYEKIEAAWRADQAALQANRAQAEAESERLTADRDARAKGMEGPVIGIYEKLRPLKAGRAVARIVRGLCEGCHISLPTHLVQRVRSGGTIVQCPNCERILVAG
ncbi:MAG TPA: C4-type zinc ribbon domain-containing protein [Dehalococcoidia bacterium]|nr:C4-type zinc ribbon domain-containing protein [Dehalococcoidia bacterium]